MTRTVTLAPIAVEDVRSVLLSAGTVTVSYALRDDASAIIGEKSRILDLGPDDQAMLSSVVSAVLANLNKAEGLV